MAGRSAPRSNIRMKAVVIDIGALRADRVGCYGYHRPTTPAIDALAAEGLRCDAAFSSDATTAGARAALFSGRFGLETGIVTDGLAGDVIEGHTPVSVHGMHAPRPLLQELLAAHGVRTAAITPFGRQPASWFYHGWCDVLDPWCARTPAEVTARDVNAVALPWLETNAGRDFLLYLTYNDLYSRADTPLDEHAAAHGTHLASFGEAPVPDESSIAAHLELHAAFAPRAHRRPTREALWKLSHDYDARLRAVDDRAAEVLRHIDALGIREQTAVIVTSDHGVMFGECGCYGGHIAAHYHCIRLPLVVRAPRMAKPGVMNGMCYGLDISATLCELAGIERPAGYQGRSLFQLAAEGRHGGRDCVVCGHGQYTAQRAILSDGWKLNRTWHAGFWQFPDTSLYHTASDSAEGDDRAAAEPDRVRELLRKMKQWMDECRGDQPDPLARIACQEPPGFLRFGQELRARVRRGELRAPEGYQGRWA